LHSPSLSWYDLNALQERHESVTQRIVDLEVTLLHVEEKKFQLKRDVNVRLLELIGC